MIDFGAINRATLAVLPAVLRRLLPDGRIVGGEWVARNPTRADRRPGSFKVNLWTGRWVDFATGDCGGDPVLYAYVEQCRQSDAAIWLAQMLGMDGGTAAMDNSNKARVAPSDGSRACRGAPRIESVQG